MKRILLIVTILFSMFCDGQNLSTYEKPPVFKECDSIAIEQLKSCFNFTLNTFLFENFKVPAKVNEESYKGDIKVLFEVNNTGKFRIIYIDAVYDELKRESHRVFDLLPEIKPATYNGNPTFVQYILQESPSSECHRESCLAIFHHHHRTG